MSCSGRQGDRKRKAAGSKFIAGVPVLNYHHAFEGQTSLAQTDNLQQDWTVVVNPGVSDEQIKALCELGDCKAVGHPSRGGVPYFEVSCTEAELEELLHQAKGAAKYVEPDSVIYAVPELDASAAASWGLDRIGTSQRSSTGAGVSVYVLDTGIRRTHNDFTGRVVPTLDNTRSPGSRECSGFANPLECAWDKQGHGTHCAGSAAGASYGVAPGATIHAVKVLNDRGSGQFSWTVDALDWIAAFGERPAVASLSLGGASRSDCCRRSRQRKCRCMRLLTSFRPIGYYDRIDRPTRRPVIFQQLRQVCGFLGPRQRHHFGLSSFRQWR